MTDLRLIPRPPGHPDALKMIEGSEAELAALYPPEVRFAFSPQELIDAGVDFVVAYLGDTPVGCGGMAPCPADPGDGARGGYGELKRIYVAPDGRRRGLAKRIVAALEETARARGLGRMRLETGEDSPDAIGLYGSLGYARRGPFGAYEENGASVFMEKRL
ncbi:MAG: GNAT family N-acetyltransferase [Pseudomonadota bacterium]